MVRTYLKILAIGLLPAVLGSCSGKDEGEPQVPPTADDGIIRVSREGMRLAPGIELYDSETDNSAPIIISQFQENDLLYFSQMPQAGSPNFEDWTEETLNYMYVYKYVPDDEASWADGYNFAVVDGRMGFNWDNVLAVGPSGNAFKFFAFHFPVGQQPVWSVQTDQTGSNGDPFATDNFMKSDIMGAYHSTSAIFTRMRFRLFHLMTYLMVKIYVPVYDGTSADYNDQSYSGFNPGAMKGAYVLNASTDFKIEWAAAKSSDSEAPLVQADETKPKNNIKMYRHNIDSDTEKTIDVTPYYGGQVDGITDNQDRVRTYQFSVLFPTQNFTGDFLCFALTTPGGDTKYYYFRGEQIVGAEGTSFGLTQGTLQELELYLPRKTNQTVVVGAKILPWKNAETDMTVNKQTND